MRKAQLFVAALLGIAATQSVRVVGQQSAQSSGAQPAVTDPLAKELERCKALGKEAGSDNRCKAAYAESNRRFFSSHDDYHPAPVDVFPKAHKEPLTTEKTPDKGAPEQ